MKKIIIVLLTVFLVSAFCIGAQATASPDSKLYFSDYGFGISFPGDWDVGVENGTILQNGEIAEVLEMTVDGFNSNLESSGYMLYAINGTYDTVYIQRYPVSEFGAENMPEVSDFRGMSENETKQLLTAVDKYMKDYEAQMLEDGCTEVSVKTDGKLTVCEDIPYIFTEFKWISVDGYEYDTLDCITLIDGEIFWICYDCATPPLSSEQLDIFNGILSSCEYDAAAPSDISGETAATDDEQASNTIEIEEYDMSLTLPEGWLVAENGNHNEGYKKTAALCGLTLSQFDDFMQTNDYLFYSVSNDDNADTIYLMHKTDDMLGITEEQHVEDYRNMTLTEQMKYISEFVLSSTTNENDLKKQGYSDVSVKCFSELFDMTDGKYARMMLKWTADDCKYASDCYTTAVNGSYFYFYFLSYDGEIEAADEALLKDVLNSVVFASDGIDSITVAPDSDTSGDKTAIYIAAAAVVLIAVAVLVTVAVVSSKKKKKAAADNSNYYYGQNPAEQYQPVYPAQPDAASSYRQHPVEQYQPVYPSQPSQTDSAQPTDSSDGEQG